MRCFAPSTSRYEQAMRIIVTGCRDWKDASIIDDELAKEAYSPCWHPGSDRTEMKIAQGAGHCDNQLALPSHCPGPVLGLFASRIARLGGWHGVCNETLTWRGAPEFVPNRNLDAEQLCYPHDDRDPETTDGRFGIHLCNQNFHFSPTFAD